MRYPQILELVLLQGVVVVFLLLGLSIIANEMEVVDGAVVTDELPGRPP
jgi:hypothetical protein